MRRTILAITGVCSLAAPALAQDFSIRMSGDQVVPPRSSPATGEGRATLNPNTRQLLFHLAFDYFELLGTEIGAHIHQAPAGSNGPVIISLPIGAVIDETYTLTAAQVTALLDNRLYVDIHTSVFPGGEIRGQIRLLGACCFGAQCQLLTPEECDAQAGLFQGPATHCGPEPCAPVCPCDWNDSSDVSSQDFFDFLPDFFAMNADLNHDGVTNSQDFFDFLACFFQPPPTC